MLVIRDASALALFQKAAMMNMASVQSMRSSCDVRDNRALLRNLGGALRILNQLSAEAPMVEEDQVDAATATASAKPLFCSAVPIALNDRHREEQVCFYMCHHALTFATPEGFLSQNNLAMAVAITIFNTALAYHLHGGTRFTKSRALQLYRHVLTTVDETYRGVVAGGDLLHRHDNVMTVMILKTLQVMAMNNSTHILLSHKELDKAAQGLNQLQPMVRSLQDQLGRLQDDHISHMIKFVLGMEVLDELAMNVLIPATTQVAEAA